MKYTYVSNKNKNNLTSDDLAYIRERVINMYGRSFEEFCVLLFKSTDKYKDVELTQYERDGGKDIILTKPNDEKIYVECKRLTPNATSTEEYMVGRVICQKLIGAMAGEGIKKGLIISTGNVHDNAKKYIKGLLNYNVFLLDIIELDLILEMCNNLSKNELSEIFKISFNSNNLILT